MSYLSMGAVRSRRALGSARYRVPGRAMSGLGDAAAANLSPECDAAGLAAQAPYDQQLADFKKTWKNRDGFFYLDDATKIIQAGLALQRAGLTIIDDVTSKYGESLSSSMKSGRDRAQNELFAIGKTALEFLNAISAARAKGATIIDAPGLRDWTIDAISAAGSAAYIGAYMDCRLVNVGAFLGPLAIMLAAKNALVSAAKGAVGVVAKVGEIVYKTTVGTLDFIAMATKYMPVLLVSGAAYLVAKELKKRRGG